MFCHFSEVKEWLHNNHKRCVKVKIGPDDSISTLNRKGEVLRKMDFGALPSVFVEVTEDLNKKPMVLVRSPRDHDLVRKTIYYRFNRLKKIHYFGNYRKCYHQYYHFSNYFLIHFEANIINPPLTVP